MGDGKSINILDQPCLRDVNEPVIRVDHIALHGVKVSKLMSTESRSWDVDIIEDLFDSRGKNMIHSIHMGENIDKDV